MKHIIGIGISLPKKLMEKIDTDRGDIPRSRYVLRMLEKQYTFEAKKDTGSLDRRIETLQSSKPLTS
jgi:metal-responsive CopG/Arc/MetJ family transcriptional regulator